jgi:glycolate oxidase FAD binding subunit
MTTGEATRRTAKALGELTGSATVLTNAATTAYRLGDVEPAAAVLPHDEAGVARVLAFASAEDLGVVPWGGGVHQSVGHLPTRYDLALDLCHLDRVVAYEPADMTATVQAGIRLADLQRRLGEAGQFWPLDPPLADQATAGGVVALNLNGPLRCRYGSVRDLVLGVRVAHADGTITKAGARVVKNATAYDLTKLYAGSCGTLGVLLEATLRLQPRPAVERGWLLTGSTLAPCHEAAMRILGSHLAPNRVELLDEGGAAACGQPGGGPALAVSVAAVPEAMEYQAGTVVNMARELGLDVGEIENPAQMWEALRDFPWRAAGWSEVGWRALWRGGVLPSECAQAMHAVHEAAGRCGKIAIAATVSHGVLRGAVGASHMDGVADGLGAAREALQALQGFLVVLEAPADFRRAVDGWGPMSAEGALMRQIKLAFDPQGILNPGRFVNGI